MGTGKKKIPIERITNEKSRMVTFSRRRKGLFKINEEVESKTGSRIASVVFSPTERPYTYGDVDFAIQKHFCRTKLSTSGMKSHQSNSDVVVTGGSRSSSTPSKNSLRKWVERIDVEGCQNLNQLLLLKEQLEGTKENLGSIEDTQLFEAMFA